MSQFLKENIYQTKNMTENRVLMLTEKINNLKIGQKGEADRKVDTLERQVSELEAELESMIANFNDKEFEIKHIFTKITKELAFDYQEMDRTLKEETQQCQDMALQMISQHVEERKASDARLNRFIDEKCAVLRDLIEKEAKERTTAIKDIEESLSRDLGEIRDKLEVECKQRDERIDEIHEQFLAQYEKMHEQFNKLNEQYAQSQSNFYKMLRDIIKKVKSQLADGKKEREDMQESILALIERICDKAIEEVGTK